MATDTETQMEKVIGAGFYGAPAPSKESLTSLVDYAAKVAKKAGVKDWTAANAPGVPLLAARVAAMIPVVSAVLPYFTAVMDAIEQIAEGARRQGYCEGYAVTMMFLSTGRSAEDAMYVERLERTTRIFQGPPDFPRPEAADDPTSYNRKLWDTLTGFFEGKAAAIKAIEEFNKKSSADANAELFAGIFSSCAERVGYDVPVAMDLKAIYREFEKLPRRG